MTMELEFLCVHPYPVKIWNIYRTFQCYSCGHESRSTAELFTSLTYRIIKWSSTVSQAFFVARSN